MTKTEKILCCQGNLTIKSTAKILEYSYTTVASIWFYYGLKNNRNPQRIIPKYAKRYIRYKKKSI